MWTQSYLKEAGGLYKTGPKCGTKWFYLPQGKQGEINLGIWHGVIYNGLGGQNANVGEEQNLEPWLNTIQYRAGDPSTATGGTLPKQRLMQCLLSVLEGEREARN